MNWQIHWQAKHLLIQKMKPNSSWSLSSHQVYRKFLLINKIKNYFSWQKPLKRMTVSLTFGVFKKIRHRNSRSGLWHRLLSHSMKWKDINVTRILNSYILLYILALNQIMCLSGLKQKCTRILIWGNVGLLLHTNNVFHHRACSKGWHSPGWRHMGWSVVDSGHRGYSGV